MGLALIHFRFQNNSRAREACFAYLLVVIYIIVYNIISVQLMVWYFTH